MWSVRSGCRLGPAPAVCTGTLRDRAASVSGRNTRRPPRRAGKSGVAVPGPGEPEVERGGTASSGLSPALRAGSPTSPGLSRHDPADGVDGDPDIEIQTLAGCPDSLADDRKVRIPVGALGRGGGAARGGRARLVLPAEQAGLPAVGAATCKRRQHEQPRQEAATSISDRRWPHLAMLRRGAVPGRIEVDGITATAAVSSRATTAAATKTLCSAGSRKLAGMPAAVDDRWPPTATECAVRDGAEDGDAERAAHRTGEHVGAGDDAPLVPFDRRLRCDQGRTGGQAHAEPDHEAGRRDLPNRTGGRQQHEQRCADDDKAEPINAVRRKPTRM